jgi:hypothetical protein
LGRAEPLVPAESLVPVQPLGARQPLVPAESLASAEPLVQARTARGASGPARARATDVPPGWLGSSSNACSGPSRGQGLGDVSGGGLRPFPEGRLRPDLEG